jgi:hypothetical protein
MKLLIIENCKQCKNMYFNYLVDKQGIRWCSLSDKQVEPDNIIQEHCKLDDADSIYQTEQEFNPSDNDPIDDNA